MMKFRTQFQIQPIYFLYWTIGCILLGVLVAPIVTAPMGEDHSTHVTHDHAKAHGQIEVDPKNAPEVSIRGARDAVSGWNVFIAVENFAFTPERVNQANLRNTGHAHLYLNGEKVTRLYGTAYHLADLPPGRHVLSVSLNANDHSEFVLDGRPIAATIIIDELPK